MNRPARYPKPGRSFLLTIEELRELRFCIKVLSCCPFMYPDTRLDEWENAAFEKKLK